MVDGRLLAWGGGQGRYAVGWALGFMIDGI